jgi:cytosine deaminase
MVANICGRVSRIRPEVWNWGSTADVDIPNVILFRAAVLRMTTAHPYLRAAIEQARKSLSEGGIPIGSVLVHDGRIIGRGHNCRVQTGSAIDHGEMNCLRNAGRLPARIYRNSTIYSTLSPCPMCSGAIVLYKIPRVVVGENKNFLGAEDYMRSQGIQVDVVQDEECIQMMTGFIRMKPELWNEDIGE